MSKGENVGMSAERLERIGAVMQGYVDRGVYAGVNTLVARRGEIVHSGSYGFKDKEAKSPMTPDTIFRLYSMTKPVVSTALMMLFEEGRFRLIDPIARYIPAFAKVKVQDASGALVDCQRPVNVRDVLTHTAGLTYGFLEDSPVCEMYTRAKLLDANVPLAEAIDDLATFPLIHQPGARWSYSVGIDVAARIIEVVSGQKLGDFLAERLFGPLGMADTGFGVAPEKLPRLAKMYGRPDIMTPAGRWSKVFALWRQGYNEATDVSKTYPVDAPETFQRGGHGLFGTIGDYLKFGQMLANAGEYEGRRYLSRKTLQLMHSNHLPAALLPMSIAGLPFLGYGFGLGSRVAMDPAASASSTSVGEFGWSGAAKTYYWVDPVEQIVGLFMTQSLTSFDLPDMDIRSVVYGAMED